MPTYNNNNYPRRDKPAPTNEPIFKAQKFYAKGEDLEESGVMVKIGGVTSRVSQFSGKTEFTLSIKEAPNTYPKNQRGYPLSVKLTFPLRCDILAALFNLTNPDEIKKKAFEVTEVEWAAECEGRNVVLFPADWVMEDKAASAEAGTKIEKTYKIIKARKVSAQAPVSSSAIPATQDASQPSAPQAGTLNGTSPKDRLAAVCDGYAGLFDFYAPKDDKPGNWVVAVAKATTAIAKLKAAGYADALSRSINFLSAEGADIGALLMPWDAAKAQELFGVSTLLELGEYDLATIRDALAGSGK